MPAVSYEYDQVSLAERKYSTEQGCFVKVVRTSLSSAPIGKRGWKSELLKNTAHLRQIDFAHQRTHLFTTDLSEREHCPRSVSVCLRLRNSRIPETPVALRDQPFPKRFTAFPRCFGNGNTLARLASYLTKSASGTNSVRFLVERRGKEGEGKRAQRRHAHFRNMWQTAAAAAATAAEESTVKTMLFSALSTSGRSCRCTLYNLKRLGPRDIRSGQCGVAECTDYLERSL